MKNVALHAVLMTAIAVFSSQLSAQQLYRIVGPDGKVTFSDQPPAPSSNAKVTTGKGGSFGSEGSGGAGLPFELRGIAQKFPVTLYTSKDCAPCDSGRNLLRNRGIPFTERTVESAEDSASLKRIAGESSLPLATVGGQQMKGYSDSEWSQTLDLAGYPKASQLPTGYRNPAPAPLVARATTAPAPAAVAAPAPAPVAAPAPSNPAGIRF